MKKILNSPWVISIGTALISVLLTIAFDTGKNKPLFTTLSKIINYIKKTFVSVMTFKVEIWHIVLFILLIAGVLFIIFNRKNNYKEPNFTNYTSDRFKRWKWSWSWYFNRSVGKWNVSNLTTSCPRCNSTMLESQDLIYGYSYECPNCDFYSQSETNEHPAKIEQLILDKIKRDNN